MAPPQCLSHRRYRKACDVIPRRSIPYRGEGALHPPPLNPSPEEANPESVPRTPADEVRFTLYPHETERTLVLAVCASLVEERATLSSCLTWTGTSIRGLLASPDLYLARHNLSSISFVLPNHYLHFRPKYLSISYRPLLLPFSRPFRCKLYYFLYLIFTSPAPCFSTPLETARSLVVHDSASRRQSVCSVPPCLRQPPPARSLVLPRGHSRTNYCTTQTLITDQPSFLVSTPAHRPRLDTPPPPVILARLSLVCHITAHFLISASGPSSRLPSHQPSGSTLRLGRCPTFASVPPCLRASASPHTSPTDAWTDHLVRSTLRVAA